MKSDGEMIDLMSCRTMPIEVGKLTSVIKVEMIYLEYRSIN